MNNRTKGTILILVAISGVGLGFPFVDYFKPVQSFVLMIGFIFGVSWIMAYIKYEYPEAWSILIKENKIGVIE